MILPPGSGPYAHDTIAPLDARRNRSARLRQWQSVGNADQHRQPHSAALRHRRLLRLPARARPHDAGAGGHDRPAAGERRPGEDADHRRAGRAGRRAASAGVRARRDAAPALQVLPRGGRGSVTHVRRRAGHRPRRAAGRPGGADGGVADVQRRRPPHAGDGGRAAGADRERGARGRELRHPGAPATAGTGAEPVVELGRGVGQPVPRARPGAVARVRPQSHPAAAADADCAARSAGVAARPARPHQLCLPAAAGVPAVEEHLGRRERQRARRAAGGLLLRGVRPARVAADLLGRPRHPRRRSSEERLGSRHPAGGHRAVLRPGLLPPAARHRRLAARGLPRRRQQGAADTAGHDAGRCAADGGDRDAHRVHPGQGLARQRRPQHAAAARLERRRQQPRGSPAHLAPLRRRRTGAHPPGAGARRRRRAGAGGARPLARRRPPERRTQRLRRARADPAAHGERRRRRRRGVTARRRARRVHHAHAGAGGSRPLRAGADRGTSRAAARRARAVARRPDGVRPRESPRPATSSSA